MKSCFSVLIVESSFGRNAGITGYSRRRRTYLSLMTTGILALALSLSGCGQAHADIIYTNFGPGQSYGSSYWGVGYFSSGDPSQVDAFQFRPGANYTFADAMIAISVTSGPKTLNVSLETDAGNTPGTILETMSVTALSSPAIETATSILKPALVSGTAYWLVVWAPSASTTGQWYFNSTGDLNQPTNTADNSIGSPTGPWFFPSANVFPRAAFEIDSVTSSAVPEPSGLALFAVGIAGLAGYHWQRRRPE